MLLLFLLLSKSSWKRSGACLYAVCPGVNWTACFRNSPSFILTIEAIKKKKISYHWSYRCQTDLVISTSKWNQFRTMRLTRMLSTLDKHTKLITLYVIKSLACRWNWENFINLSLEVWRYCFIYLGQSITATSKFEEQSWSGSNFFPYKIREKEG